MCCRRRPSRSYTGQILTVSLLFGRLAATSDPTSCVSYAYPCKSPRFRDILTTTTCGRLLCPPRCGRCSMQHPAPRTRAAVIFTLSRALLRGFAVCIRGPTFTCISNTLRPRKLLYAMAPAQCTVCDEKFKSKSECNIHRAYVGHGAPAVFFCVECSQTFVKLKELKNHRNTEGHTRTTLTVTSLEDAENVLSRPPGIAEDWRPPLAIRGDNSPAIRAANCPTCCESFKTYQELAAVGSLRTFSRRRHPLLTLIGQHRRTAHGQEIQVAFKCPRCAQAIPFGEVHGRCTPPVRPACAICRQRFGSTAELVEVSGVGLAQGAHTTTLTRPVDGGQHRLANPVSCDICAVHLPQWLTLQEHWRVSNQHPYCELCDNAFKNQRAWVAVSDVSSQPAPSLQCRCSS